MCEFLSSIQSPCDSQESVFSNGFEREITGNKTYNKEPATVVYTEESGWG